MVRHEKKQCAPSPCQVSDDHNGKADEHERQNDRGVVRYCEFLVHIKYLRINLFFGRLEAFLCLYYRILYSLEANDANQVRSFLDDN